MNQKVLKIYIYIKKLAKDNFRVDIPKGSYPPKGCYRIKGEIGKGINLDGPL